MKKRKSQSNVPFHMIVPTAPYPKHIQAIGKRGKKYPKQYSNLNSKPKPTMSDFPKALLKK